LTKNKTLDDPSSPSCTLEQQSEPDLWSDIEQNSSDHFHDNDLDGDEITSDDETTTISTSFNTDSATTEPTQLHPNSASRFWQYNVQAKGPKTKRILYLKERDPHLHREFSDPVYQIKLTQTKGQTFAKLRKGDGNDVTPNPLKLYQLGKQIQDLSMGGKTNSNAPSVYHGIYHVDQQSNNNDTAEVKKEKNKIASRYVFLKKSFFWLVFNIYYSELVDFVRKHSMKQINSNYMVLMKNTVSPLIDLFFFSSLVPIK